MSPTSLRHARAQLGMSQVELAAALGVSRTAYQKWEMGTAPIVRRTEFSVRWLMIQRVRGLLRSCLQELDGA